MNRKFRDPRGVCGDWAGPHHVGSSLFWYFKEPAGNFSEYYSDMDCILDDALWKAGDWTAHSPFERRQARVCRTDIEYPA